MTLRLLPELLRHEVEKISPVLEKRYESKQAVDEVLENLIRSQQMRQGKAEAAMAKAGK